MTDIGQSRQENQDYYFIDLMPEQQQAFCVVCDGMGGAKAGNIASEMAANIFSEEVHQRIKPKMKHKQLEQVLENTIAVANALIHKKSKENADYTGMGTTLVGFIASGDLISIVNVGDSRAYLITKHGIDRITQDHSLVEDMVRRGDITREQARVHPNKNLITRALGTAPVVHGDYHSMELESGDIILLCSDGLSNLVSDQEILYEILHGGERENCCERLLSIVNSRGAPDNVTIVLFEAGDMPGQNGMESRAQHSARPDRK